MKLSSDPTSNKILLAVLDESSDLNTQTWSGSAWGSDSEHEGSMKTASERDFDVAYQANGTALLVYGESGVETPRYSDSTWSSEYRRARRCRRHCMGCLGCKFE